MQIRPAQLSDLEAIVAIYNASIPGGMATADTKPVSVESRREWFAAHTPDKRPMWVAEEASGGGATRVAGWVGFRSFYGRPAYEPTVEVSVYVHPDFHRRGIGRALMVHAIGAAPSVGVRTLLGFAFGHNTPSVRLLESLGFEHWGRLPGIAHMPDGRRDLVMMGLNVE